MSCYGAYDVSCYISEDHKTQKFLLLGLFLENPLVSCTVDTGRVTAESGLN